MNKHVFLCINIIKGNFLIDKNLITQMDTYCIIEIGKHIRFRTNTSKSGTKPIYNYIKDTIFIPYDTENIFIKT